MKLIHSIHAYLIKKNYPVSKTRWNKFTQAAARHETLPKAMKFVIVHWPRNYTLSPSLQFQPKLCVIEKCLRVIEMSQKNTGRLSGCT